MVLNREIAVFGIYYWRKNVSNLKEGINYGSGGYISCVDLL